MIELYPDTIGRSVAAQPDVFFRIGMLAILGGLLSLVAGHADTFSYQDFDSTTGLNLLGHAQPLHGRLRVTPAVPGLGLGAVWRDTRQPVKEGFDTTFQIQITDKYCFGADGMAFVVQNGPAPTLGVPGCMIGFGGLTNLLVVKFDNYHFQDHANGRFDEVAVLAAGSPSTVLWDSASNTLASVTNGVVFSDGAVHTARILYVPGNLRVYLDDLDNPLMTVYVNLAKVLDLDAGAAWVGFTAASGADWQNQDLVSWSFASDDTLSRLRRAMAGLRPDATAPVRETVGRSEATMPADSAPPAPGFPLSLQDRPSGVAQTGTDPNLSRTNLLLITAYGDEGRMMTEMSVTASGQERHRRLARGAFQIAESRALTGPEMDSLREALADLPAESQSPPLGRLIIVSFRQGANWLTRTYDSATPPAALQKVYDILWNTGSQ